MLNNNPNPLRAAYPELDGRTAMEALQNPAIAGAAAGLPVFTGPGGVAEAKTAEAARASLGLPYETGTWMPSFLPGVTFSGTPTFKGKYLKIANLVYVQADFVGLIENPNDVAVRLVNLPFVPTESVPAMLGGHYDITSTAPTSGGYVAAIVSRNGIYGFEMLINGGNATALKATAGTGYAQNIAMSAVFLI